MNEQRRVPIEQATRARFTAREFERMIAAGAFDDMKVELVRGELERMPPPETLHANWQIRVAARLLAIFGELHVFGDVGIDLGQDTVVGCDAAVVRRPVTENRRLRPADLALIVEVAVSSVGRDLGLKRELYAEAEVVCYWVVDPEREVTHVYREPVNGEYRSIATVAFGEPLEIPGEAGSLTLG